MDVRYINPFIESVYDLFSTMLGCEAHRGNVKLSTDAGSEPEHLVALIGLSGPARGTVALALPMDTAKAVTAQLLGAPATSMTDVADAVAELANMIAGSAKARMVADDGAPINLGLPTVVSGRNYNVHYPNQARWLEVPFTSELGLMTLRVTFEEVEVKKGVHAA